MACFAVVLLERKVSGRLEGSHRERPMLTCVIQ
jgi:hypothetical protein